MRQTRKKKLNQLIKLKKRKTYIKKTVLKFLNVGDKNLIKTTKTYVLCYLLYFLLHYNKKL